MKTQTLTSAASMGGGYPPQLAFGMMLLAYAATRVHNAANFFSNPDWTPQIAETTMEAIGNAPSVAEGDWVGTALQSVKSGAMTAWNWVPASTRLLLGAWLVYWVWKKWKAQTDAGIHIHNHHKVEIHLHGGETRPDAVERIVKEKDGSTTTVIDLKAPKREFDGRKFALLNLNL